MAVGVANPKAQGQAITITAVKAIKAKERPIVPEQERAEMVAALKFVDGVVIFDDDTPLRVIEHLLPDVLVKGGDWQQDRIVASDVVKKAGGEVKSIPFVPGIFHDDHHQKDQRSFLSIKEYSHRFSADMAADKPAETSVL